MTGICDNGHEVHWRNTRGSRKPETCHFNDCGATVHQARYNTATKRYERQVAGSRSGKLTQCTVCPRKVRVVGDDSPWIMKKATTFKVWVNGVGYEMKTAQSGDVVCWRHYSADGN